MSKLDPPRPRLRGYVEPLVGGMLISLSLVSFLAWGPPLTASAVGVGFLDLLLVADALLRP
jgi:hypothetical protein